MCTWLSAGATKGLTDLLKLPPKDEACWRALAFSGLDLLPWPLIGCDSPEVTTLKGVCALG